MEHVVRLEGTHLGPATRAVGAPAASSSSPHDSTQLADYSHNYTESEPGSGRRTPSSIAGAVAGSMHNSTHLLQLQQLADFENVQEAAAAVAAAAANATSAARKLMKGRGHRSGRRGVVKSQLVCKVDGCNTVLSSSKAYYQRHRVCAAHLAAMSAPVDGVVSRFCQQCGKFQPLEEFDNDKRSCRSRLKRHNNRRREQRHSKNLVFHSYPHSPIARLDPVANPGGLGPLDPHNPDSTIPQSFQGLPGSGLALKPAQVSPNPSGDHSSSAAVQFEASPGSPAGPPGAAATAAATATGGGGGMGQPEGSVLGGRLTVRRSSASKALEAFKSMNASSNSTASEFEDDNMEEAHQRSPMMAAAAAAAAICRSRRKLDMNAATNAAAAAAAADDDQQPGGFRNHGQGSLGSTLNLNPQGPGFAGNLSSAELAAAVQAAAVGGVYNKCAMSAAGSSGSSDLGFGNRSHLGLSRFAVQNPAAAGLGCISQQSLLRQQWGQHAGAALQHSYSIAHSGQYSPSSLAPVPAHDRSLSSNAVGPCVGALAQQHSAPPFLHAPGSGNGYSDHGCDPRTAAAAAAAGRYSDAGLLASRSIAPAIGPYSGEPRQQQEKQQLADTYAGLPGSAAAQQLYSSSDMGDRGINPDTAADSHQQQQQQHGQLSEPPAQWRAPLAAAGYNSQVPLSLQVLAQLRAADTFLGSPMSLSPVLQQQQQQQPQQQQQQPFSLPRGQYLSSQGSGGHQAAAPSETAAQAAVTPGHLSNARVGVSPFQVATRQPQLLVGRPYASFSGAEGLNSGLSEGPCASLTAPLRANLAGFSLGQSGSFSGWPNGSQQLGQQQPLQHINSWPGSHPVHNEQQQGMQAVLIKQGSSASQHSHLQAVSALGVDSPSQMFIASTEAEAGDRWMEDIPSPNAQQHLQQQQQQEEQEGDPNMAAGEMQQCVAGIQDNAWPDTCQPGTAPHEFPCAASVGGQHQAYADTAAEQQQEYYQIDRTASGQRSAAGSSALRRLPSAGAAAYPDRSDERGHHDTAGLDVSRQCSFLQGTQAQQQAAMHGSGSRPPSCAGDVTAQQNTDGNGRMPCTDLPEERYPYNATDVHGQQGQHTMPGAAGQHECTQGATVVGSPTAPAAEHDGSMMQCMSTDEDFGDLLELLLEGEVQQ